MDTGRQSVSKPRNQVEKFWECIHTEKISENSVRGTSSANPESLVKMANWGG